MKIITLIITTILLSTSVGFARPLKKVIQDEQQVFKYIANINTESVAKAILCAEGFDSFCDIQMFEDSPVVAKYALTLEILEKALDGSSSINDELTQKEKERMASAFISLKIRLQDNRAR